jgi:hypothetical protein
MEKSGQACPLSVQQSPIAGKMKAWERTGTSRKRVFAGNAAQPPYCKILAKGHKRGATSDAIGKKAGSKRKARESNGKQA